MLRALRCGLVVGLALIGFAASAAGQSRRMDLDDLGLVVRVSDPQIAPDGQSIVVVVARANYEDNRYDADLVMVDVASGAQRVLTRDRRGVSQPRFSAKGDRIAFLAATPTGTSQQARPQILVMPLDGGDTYRVTNTAKGVQQYAWSPDGRSFAFVTEDDPEPKKGPERFNDSFEVENDNFLIQSPALPSHLWTIPAAGGEAQRLTSGTWGLPVAWPPGSPASPVNWSPDSSSITFVRVVSPHSGDSNHATVQVIDVGSKQIRAVTGNNSAEAHPTFSPDGASVAYWQPRDLDAGNVSEIHVAPARGGAGRSLTRALDRNIARSIWMPGGTSLLVGANDGTRVSLWIQPLEGAARKLNLGSVSPASAFWVDVAVSRNGAIAFTGTDTTRPAELYYMASVDAAPKRLTDFNSEVAGRMLGRTEVVTWQSDGFTHNGTLTYPPDFTASQRYPLVLVIHGGPRAASLETFSPPAQIMAAKGWIVFQPNYRGSDQGGNAYQRAIVNDAGAGPGRDVMAGVDLVKKRGFIDTSRVAVSGWSYGGYMTTWLLGNYTGWRVGVAGAAVTDWRDQYNLGDANVRRGAAFGGSPWTDPKRMQAYIDQSPITYAPKIRAPTLVMTNTQDYRVPPTQSYMLYHALRDNGVPTKFVAYPIYGHNATDPVRQRDVQRRWIGWIEQHFQDASKTSAVSGGR
jgi:dipeptidyl aminopeptidase/acylaminoacyl peptidase